MELIYSKIIRKETVRKSMPKGVYKRKPFTESHKINMKLCKIGTKGGMRGKKHKLSTIELMKKRRHSIKAKIKIGLASKGNKYCLGKKQSEEAKIKRSNSIIKFYNEKGRVKHKRYYHSSASKEYKGWKSNVFQRDNWTCQTCGVRGCYLEAHHIKSWAHYPELRFELSNGLTLCRECHKLTDNYKGKGKKNA